MKGGAGGGGFAEWKWAGWLRWWLHKVSSTWRVSRFEGILASCPCTLVTGTRVTSSNTVMN
jgi:hypothetical protein